MAKTKAQQTDAVEASADEPEAQAPELTEGGSPITNGGNPAAPSQAVQAALAAQAFNTSQAFKAAEKAQASEPASDAGNPAYPPTPAQAEATTIPEGFRQVHVVRPFFYTHTDHSREHFKPGRHVVSDAVFANPMFRHYTDEPPPATVNPNAIPFVHQQREWMEKRQNEDAAVQALRAEYAAPKLSAASTLPHPDAGLPDIPPRAR